jgi:transitional endoplasmic reticulum ATPase
MLAKLPGETIVVILQLDLLSGGDSSGGTAGEFSNILDEARGRGFLAFSDPSTSVPSSIANRFAVQIVIDHLPRTVRRTGHGNVPVGEALVTKAEASLFEGFDGIELYPYIAGMNAIQLREGIRYAYRNCIAADPGRPAFAALLRELQIFKVKKSSSFSVPTVSMDRIGGYQDVKRRIVLALRILSDAARGTLPGHVLHDFAPKGFLFYGPPGTGKKMIAEAIASELTGTIAIVPAQEIVNGGRRLRDLFSEARHCAPAVLVLDELDAMAGRRPSPDEDQSPVENDAVTQLLVELENFHPEAPVIIIGTTNRIDLIDELLVRPQRLQPIMIALPDSEDRYSIARIYAAEFEIPVSEASLDAIAFKTAQMSGDDIRSIFFEARADSLATGMPADTKHLGEIIDSLLQRRRRADPGKRLPGMIGNPRQGSKKRVFISYVREDSIQVDRIAQTLRVYGLDVWLDRTHIAPGERWQQAIGKAIREGNFFIACFSPAYAERDSTYMNEELRIAVGQLRLMPLTKRWFVPVMLEKCQIPLFPIDSIDTLNSLQYIDFSNDWDAAMRKLINAILSDS